MFSSNSSQVSSAANWIEDCFSCFLYQGNGSTQTITNGIDLSTKGGLLWIKCRNNASNQSLFDSARGANNQLYSNLTTGQDPRTGNSFNTDGFTIGLAGGSFQTNNNGGTYASWTFRKQPKFFDVLTYTGDGSSNRNISHSLGSTPGCIIVKRTNAGGNDWWVWHRSISTGNLSGNNLIRLNLTAAATSGTTDILGTASSTTFQVGFDGDVNGSGQTYVAYLFAHDAGGFGLTGTDNVISCGSFTTDGSGFATVNLGYEPQWVLIKRTDISGINWLLFDTMRGWTVSGDDAALFPNTSGAESVANRGNPTATGFEFSVASQNNGAFIYIAIRRGPMKTPTSGTSVFTPDSSSAAGNQTITAGFPTDMLWQKSKPNVGDWYAGTRLQGNAIWLNQNSTAAETNFSSIDPTVLVFTNAQNSVSTNLTGSPISYAFRRAPGFFDVVCYTGNGNTTQYLSTNLGVQAEMILLKRRSTPQAWYVRHKDLGFTGFYPNLLQLNSNSAVIAGTSSLTIDEQAGLQFGVRNSTTLNVSGDTYVAYLFASCPGVSKVGSYTGTGALQTINCGFAGGARFVLIKRTDSTGDWFVYDSARGISSGNDPYLLLNSTAAEVTGTNYVDTTSVGFQVTAAAPAGLNASGGSYIFLAVA